VPGKISIVCNDISMTASLNDSPAAQALLTSLPLEGLVQARGDEVYFFVNFSVDTGDLVEEVATGTIAYWPAGSAVCMFYGSEPVTPVEVIGKLDGDPVEWRGIMSGEEIKVTKA